MSDRLFSKPGERPYEAPDGWTFTLKRHAAHGCGWTHASPFDDSPGHRARVIAHAAVCPWPDMPEHEPSVSD